MKCEHFDIRIQSIECLAYGIPYIVFRIYKCFYALFILFCNVFLFSFCRIDDDDVVVGLALFRFKFCDSNFDDIIFVFILLSR